MQKPKSIQIYLKDDIEEERILLTAWDVCRKRSRPQVVFRRMLREGLRVLIENGELPDSILEDISDQDDKGLHDLIRERIARKQNGGVRQQGDRERRSYSTDDQRISEGDPFEKEASYSKNNDLYYNDDEKTPSEINELSGIEMDLNVEETVDEPSVIKRNNNDSSIDNSNKISMNPIDDVTSKTNEDDSVERKKAVGEKNTPKKKRKLKPIM